MESERRLGKQSDSVGFPSSGFFVLLKSYEGELHHPAEGAAKCSRLMRLDASLKLTIVACGLVVYVGDRVIFIYIFDNKQKCLVNLYLSQNST